MPLDGIVISALVTELNEQLEFGKIEKVHQPENDEIVLIVRNFREQKRVLISCNTSYPQICITDKKQDNPLKAPMFCMLLRKYLQGGKILGILQNGMDRIIIFRIESRDELGNLTINNLIVELMGKHSNIILINEETKLIIDSIKRVPEHVSSVRQILPNIPYTEQPMSKLNLFETNFDDFVKDLNAVGTDMQIYKYLYTKYQGISPSVAQEILLRSDIFQDLYFSEITSAQMRSLWQTIDWLKKLVNHGKFQPNIIYDNTHKSIDFAPILMRKFTNENYRIVIQKDMSHAIENFYHVKNKEDKYRQKSTNLRKVLSTRLNRLYKKLTKLKEDLYYAENAEIHKIQGELLIANLHLLAKGMSEIKVLNYYEPDSPEITIKLDVRLSPSENAQTYFKRYNKLKTALVEVKNQLRESKSEIIYLENVMNSIDTSLDVSNLDTIRDELIEEGYLKKRQSKSKKNTTKQPKPLEYKSTDGFRILVGRNNKENDHLTLKYASNSDTWLHTKAIPGSHVIIRSEGKDVPQTTLDEAAKLAAWHSKGRASENVPVDFTFVKNVKKPSGAKPGMVIYTNNQTLYVTPLEDEIAQLAVDRN